ncbi:KAP family P-loop NTPase fold protein [Tenacibaculum maritimum]|uniref:KAP family P-loop NTPase fold protein n=1 Tax=Tenacibaculum maritimum TaxID=107401 RepID=UPI001E4FAA19|nr:P-loop NTPase fold protein [Tenacibaculum maritimum]MCD9584399.1 KAP family NTPase [Tenacibaculum maritimum]MCD9619339.1 KAP family NTPase [Tenacibaculum maritimum]MCD9627586.1 KAP family NTPase [Tenacibaculum maritimum]MCD9630181.1 KAP family NTPase [Tenacibaculum maritimum]MCD9632163.1 KAP family NTPase [Tenacibaculum maritimum]
MHTDLPLTNSEHDKLGRFLFATEIATGLVDAFSDNNESVVLGINGTWGSGKSTLINFIIQEVERLTSEQEKQIITLRFNPWMFTGQKELQNIFLMELLVKLQTKKEILKDVSEKVANFLEHFSFVKHLHSGAGTAVDTVKGILDGVSKHKDLSDLKEDVDKLLIESGVKLYITIDDIDRLTPSEITDIFQMVKLNGNFANTVFILAYDRDVVTSALNKQFGDNGKKYIEKIVQIDYTLPVVSKVNMKRIFGDSLSQLFKEGEIAEAMNKSIDLVKDEKFVEFFESLRDIYRYTNSIKLRFPSVYKELNIREFFIIEALRIFRPESYEFILENKESLVYKKRDGANQGFGIRVGGNNQNKTSEVIEKSSFDLFTKGLLKSLFVISDNYVYSSGQPEDLIREKRVANRNYFDRYFSLQLGDFDIPETEFETFITSENIEEQIEVLEKIKKKDKLFHFLNWVDFKSRRSTPEQDKNMTIAGIKFCSSLSYSRGGFFSLGSDFMIVQRFVNRIVKGVPNVIERQKIFLDFISKANDKEKFVALFMTNGILFAKQTFDEGKLYSDKMWYGVFDREDSNTGFIKEVKKLHKRIVKQVFQIELVNKGTLTDDELTLTLQEVKKTHEELYNVQFPSLIEDDHDLIKYLWICIQSSYMTSSGGGDGGSVGYQFAEYQLFDGMNKDEIKKRIDKLNRDDFSEDENKIMDFFLTAYSDGFIKGRYYNIKDLSILSER